MSWRRSFPLNPKCVHRTVQSSSCSDDCNFKPVGEIFFLNHKELLWDWLFRVSGSSYQSDRKIHCWSDNLTVVLFLRLELILEKRIEKKNSAGRQTVTFPSGSFKEDEVDVISSAEMFLWIRNEALRVWSERSETTWLYISSTQVGHFLQRWSVCVCFHLTWRFWNGILGHKFVCFWIIISSSWTFSLRVAIHEALSWGSLRLDDCTCSVGKHSDVFPPTPPPTYT